MIQRLLRFNRKVVSLLRLFLCILSLCVFNLPVFAQNRQIAITIDDLPFVGGNQNQHLNQILHALKQDDVPATGFIIANHVKPNHWPMLRKFRESGFGLGNHTASHLNLNQVDLDTYIQDVDEADKRLAPFLSEPKFFRYPYLAMGDTQKKNKVLAYLKSKHYHIAPISIDSKDFIFNQLLLSIPQENRHAFLETLTPAYVNFVWQQTLKAEARSKMRHQSNDPQILLIHANLLNAYALPEIINLYRIHGYRFISLEAALMKSESQKEADPETFVEWD